MTQPLSLIFSLLQWHNNCHLYSPSLNDTTIVTYILSPTMSQQLSLIFSLIKWHNHCHLYSLSYNDTTIVTYILPYTTLHFAITDLSYTYTLDSSHSSTQHYNSLSSTTVKAPKHPQCLAAIHCTLLQSTHPYSQLVVEFPWQSQKALSRRSYCRSRFVFPRIGHEFPAVSRIIWGYSVWTMLLLTLLEPRILRWFLDF